MVRDSTGSSMGRRRRCESLRKPSTMGHVSAGAQKSVCRLYASVSNIESTQPVHSARLPSVHISGTSRLAAVHAATASTSGKNTKHTQTNVFGRQKAKIGDDE